ncbi:DUF4011 domain-containing protein [Desulfosporosinus sp. HMP52]|uniref:DUF4011 domain-containing protein n=1 Tax=Desulfosporosinus sp. HMP52 TaxID=1487923 RepID=UPI000557692B|nr:DUF4011 domain-containing protein [Desulfosporosinus sp. HMP52]
MSVMVLLASKDGSKVATVACPKCGRISRQILRDEYKSSPIAELRSAHTCPVCGTTFASSSSAEIAKHSGSYARYTALGEQSYNSDIRTTYSTIQSRSSKTPNATHIAAEKKDIAHPINTTEVKIMVCNVTFPGSARRYAYISDDLTIKANDKVIVPVGFDNAEKDGIVVSTGFYDLSDAPYPVEKTKHIIRKAISANLQPPQNITEQQRVPNVSVAQPKITSTAIADADPKTQASTLDSVIQDTVSIPKAIPVVDGGHSNKDVLKRKAEHWKKQLLDLSKRNKMISYRETKRATLKILEPEYTELFNRLAVAEEELTFQRPIDKDSDLRTFSMLSLLETLSYPIPVHVGDIKAEGSLLERRIALNNLRSKSKLARDEQGTNILYLSFGFIEWRENNSPNAQWLKSPVLMMPVSLKLESIQASYTLLRYDDDIEVNPTLDYLFNERFGIDLPTFELNGEESIDQYMQTIEEIADQYGWKLLREVNLGLLSFLKISMYHDLNNNYDRMLKNPVIRAITGDTNAANNIPSELTQFDFDRVSPNDCYQVVNSDSSQQEAILLSKAGVSFVMQGPPGTGKSQTITNIIAEALADGKTVLFVSEKAAALQVVYKRLAEVGLDDFCLALHSHKANKKEILDSIAANLKLPRKRMKDSAMFELTELFQDRQVLNQYVCELHEEILPLEKSLYDVFGELTYLQNAPYIQFNIEEPASISSSTYNRMLYRVSNYDKALKSLGIKLSENPWNGTAVKMVTQSFRDDLSQNTSNLPDFLLVLAESLTEVISSFDLKDACTWLGALRVVALFDAIENTPLFPLKWSQKAERNNLLEEAKRAKFEKQEYLNALNDVHRYFSDTVFDVDLSAWLEAIHQTAMSIVKIDAKLNVEVTEIMERADVLQAFANGVIAQLENIIRAYEVAYNYLPINVATFADLDEYARTLADVLNSPVVIPAWFGEQSTLEAQNILATAKIHADTLFASNALVDKQWDSHDILTPTYKHRDLVNGIVVDLNSIIDAFTRGIEIFPIQSDANDSILDINVAFKHIAELLDSPRVFHKWFNSVVYEKAKQMLKVASTHASLLIEKENWLALHQWDNKALDIDAEGILFRFKTEYTSFFKIFKSSYRADIKTIRGVSKKVGTKFTIDEITELLQTIIDICAEKKWFTEFTKELSECFGDFYSGKESNWSAIEAGLSYADSIRALFPNVRVPNKVIDMICEKTLHTDDYTELGKVFSIYNNVSIKKVEERIAIINADYSSYSIKESLLPTFTRMIETCEALILLVQNNNEKSLFELNTLDALITIITEINKLGVVFEKVDISSLLNNMISLCEEKRWFVKNHCTLSMYFGELYVGHASDWDDIETGLTFVKQIHSAFPQSTVPKNVIDLLCDKANHDYDYTELYNSLTVLSREAQEAVNADIAKVMSDYSNKDIREFLMPSFIRLHEQSETQINLISQMTVHAVQPIPNSSLLGRIVEAHKVYEKQMALHSTYQNYEGKFGKLIAGLETDWVSIISDLESVSVLFSHDNSNLMTEAFIAQFCEETDFRTKITAAKSDLKYRIGKSERGYAELKRLFEAASDFDNAMLDKVARRVDACLNNIMLLDNWISCVETKTACNELGLADFIDKIEQHDNTFEDVVSIFKRGFFTLWVRSVIGSKKMVEQFRRHNHDEKINRFVSLDERQLLIAQERIRQNVINGIPDTNRVLSANDELSILQKEITKKRKIMPLRKLFKFIPNLLLKLKPCMMMSPLSVAYFLEAESYEFDMVIFDEASQIFPQDAIGSIFRGKQVIIAGDSKQLPPTNFFATSTSNDDDDFDKEGDEAVGIEIYDSILEETTGVLPNRTLLWHYRSKHENLIAFSNQEIYKNELVTFPSSVNNGVDTGVEFVYVENGVYEGKGRNTSEARRCVELVRQHIEKTPTRSLGIIAFSESQQKTISLEIQKLREQHPEYESFFTEDKEDEFFVKNLENVQGDERDTIIFSVSYAKTKEQRDNNRPMALRFGPLGQKGGERRLNVAITRAKCNVKLVSSILPSDIDLSRTGSEGVKMLSQYIEFAMNGSSTLRAGQTEAEKDVFLDVVSEFIISHGYKIKKYVGCSGYRIDIAVFHPNNDNCFVAGIECDGPSYAAAKSARDRDRLRKSVLETMGWKIYRVWSPEWMARQDIEGQKMLTFIDTAIKEFKEVKKAQEPAPPDITPSTELFAEVIEENEASAVQSMLTSIETKMSNPYGFVEYKEAVWHETPNIIKLYNDDRVAEVIKYIVGIEQPIYVDLLYQRMAGTFGNQKATAPVRNAVDRVMKSNRLKSIIIKDKDGFITLAGFQKLYVRVPAEGSSPRQINFISPEEIGLAMLTITEQTIGLTSEGLIDATAKALGYARKGERMMTCMNNALERLVKQGRIKLYDGKVRIMGGENLG